MYIQGIRVLKKSYKFVLSVWWPQKDTQISLEIDIQNCLHLSNK